MLKFPVLKFRMLKLCAEFLNVNIYLCYLDLLPIDPIWLRYCHKISIKLLAKSLSLYISWYNLVGEGTLFGHHLPWAISFFFLNEKKINIFRLMHIALFLKVTYKIQIFWKKNHILCCFSWKVTFSMSKVNFWMFSFIKTRRLNIDSFTNENLSSE